MQKNPVCWWELASHDSEETVEFLRKAFEWEINYDAQQGLYDVPGDEHSMGGGVFTLRKAKLPFLTIYVKVDDVDAKAKLVEELGGFIVIPPFTLPSGARLCLFNEPSGVTLAMIQPVAKK